MTKLDEARRAVAGETYWADIGEHSNADALAEAIETLIREVFAAMEREKREDDWARARAAMKEAVAEGRRVLGGVPEVDRREALQHQFPTKGDKGYGENDALSEDDSEPAAVAPSETASAASDAPAIGEMPVAGDALQSRVALWMDACFGPVISADKIERNHRFLEEALELVQACGCSQSEAHQLVDYVFNRPQGDVNQEVGGVMITLAALCLANGFNMHVAGETELARIWGKIDTIRAKQAAKPKHGPLPEQQPVAGDVAKQLARAIVAAMPVLTTLIDVTDGASNREGINTRARQARDEMSEALAAYRKETDNGA